ncbi:MAG: hypothetical protein V8R85_03855 [Frisingicoccus sp.]
MNDKFFNLPEEKQQRIINAGYHVFSQNSYKKALSAKSREPQALVNLCSSIIFAIKKNSISFYGIRLPK